MHGKKAFKMRILNLEPYLYSKTAIEKWKQSGFTYEESDWNSVDEFPFLNKIDIIIVRLKQYVSETQLSKFSNLKYIISAATGFNHLDFEVIRSKNIKVYSLKGHLDFLNQIPSTSEMTWALIMSLTRKIPIANQHVLKGGWNRDKFLGTQLKGKKLGIVGFGRVGKHIAKYATAFDMEMSFYDPYEKNHDSLFKHDTLESLLISSDIISFHVPLNNETYHLLNKKNISYLKNNCILINTSRGNIWDEKALCRAISQNRIGGIGTDVLSDEFNDIKKNHLWRLFQRKNRNIIITPHIGGATIDAMRACEDYIADYFINNYKMK